MINVIPPYPFDEKKTFRRVGRVADFCCSCRTVRPFAVDETTEYARFLYIPLGFTRETTYKGTCERCGLVMPLRRGTYAALSSSSADDIVALTCETFPDIANVRAARLALEARFSGSLDPVSEEERRVLIEDPIRATAVMLDDIRRRDFVTDTHYKDGCLLAGLFFLGIMALVLFLERNGWTELLLWALIVLMLFTGWRTLIYRLRRTARALRDVIYPMLGRTLRPLSPAPAELEDILTELRRQGVAEARRLDAHRIHAAVQQARLFRRR